MHARMASGVLLALGLVDLAALDLLLAPRLSPRREEAAAPAAIAAPPAIATDPAPAPAPTSAPAPVAANEDRARPLVEAAPDIVFGVDSIRVPPGYPQAALQRVVNALRADPDKRLLVRGHSDHLGASPHNLALS